MRNFLIGATIGFVFNMLFMCATARADTQPLIFIDAEIAARSVAPIRSELLRRLALNDASDIDILIDSPGGEVIAGQELINLISVAKAKGYTVSCYVLDVAASMAFQILTACSERYAMPGSFLLWHGIRVETRVPITTELARDLSASLAGLDRLVKRQLYGALSLPKAAIDEHFRTETLWSGYSLHASDPKFLQLVAAYPDLFDRLPKAVITSKPTLFLFGGVYRYMYIWKQAKP